MRPPNGEKAKQMQTLSGRSTSCYICTSIAQCILGTAGGIIFLCASKACWEDNREKWIRWRTWYFWEGLALVSFHPFIALIILTSALFACNATLRAVKEARDAGDELVAQQLLSQDNNAGLCANAIQCCTCWEVLMCAPICCFTFVWSLVGASLAWQTGFNSTSRFWFFVYIPVTVATCCLGLCTLFSPSGSAGQCCNQEQDSEDESESMVSSA